MRDRSEASTLDLDVDAIVEVFDAAPVTRAILFGSYARGDDRSASDVDLAVEFERSLSSVERTRARLQLIEQVSAALGTDEVDVVPLSNAPETLRREIREDGIVLYGPESPPEPIEEDAGESDHEETIARFDRILAQLERIV